MDRVSVQALLTGRSVDYLRIARPLLRALELTHHLDVAVLTEPAGLSVDRTKVILAASDRSLDEGQAEELTEFVKRGGGLVVLGGTLAAWNERGALGAMARWTASGPAPQTELVLSTDARHPITATLGLELRLTDQLYLSEGPPADSSILVRTSWHFTEQVVAYEREFGAGTFIHIGLGSAAATYEDISFQKLVHRALLSPAGHSPPPPLPSPPPRSTPISPHPAPPL